MAQLKQVTKEFVKLTRVNHLNYLQLKYIFSDVRKELGLKPMKKAKRHPQLMTSEELKSLIAFGYQKHPYKGLIVRTLLLTGARVNEFVNIKVEDFHFEECEIYIHVAKGGKNRTVPIDSNLALELQQYRNSRKVGYLFETQDARMFSTRRIQQIVREVAIAAGIQKRVYPHLLRHQIATYLHNNGMPLEHVQKFLGHENPQTTQIYAELATKPMKDTYKRALQGSGRVQLE